MAYLALYRKYRPQSFDEVVGQKAVIKTLTNALKNNKIAHAYLFCGPRGTGKTSLARLFAKSLNCSEGVGEECNKCDNCLAVIKGNHPDVFEVDAASNSGVDNVRQLIEQVSFQPILGRYKVYIIDEVHSMSASAFNALLKTLEEPPSHVVFILATTEPNKVLPTILSRVQRYDFTKVSDEDLVYKMSEILEKEGIEYEESALKLIARLADGGVRDSLSLLDQAISYCGNYIKEEEVYSLFGLLQIEDKLELLKKIHVKDLKGVLNFASSKYSQGADILKLHDDLINIYKDLLVFGTTRDPSLLTLLKPEEALRTLVTPREIRHNLDVLIEQRRAYKFASNAFDQFELTLLKLCLDDVSVSVTNEQKEIKKPIEEKKDILVDAIKVEPIEEEVKEEPAKEVSSTTIKTSAMQYVSPDSEGDELIELNSDEVINMMMQGNKQTKQNLLDNWSKLESIPATSELYLLASSLRNGTLPRIACKNVVIVETDFKNIIYKINNKNAQKELKEIMNKVFNLDVFVLGLIHKDYVDYVSRYLNLAQANMLPKVHEITLFEGIEEKATNAEAFIESLKE